MSTIQKVMATIRELKEEELEMVGGLAGTKNTAETWKWSTYNGQTVIDGVLTTEYSD